MPNRDTPLFGENLPLQKAPEPPYGSDAYPIWTRNKSQLIQKYLRYFILVTEHGSYIDGFAGPQRIKELDLWSARLVMEFYPRWLRNLVLCEIDSKKIELLKEYRDKQPPRNKEKKEPKRTIEILAGDFNANVDAALAAAGINERTAAFCLLDQRTFECHWTTVEKVARYKPAGAKIELFYFLPIGWLKRAISGVRDTSILDRWWGGPDWAQLKSLDALQTAELFRERIRKEFGYSSVMPWPIYARKGSQKVMYFMVHASDHPEAPKLMQRAYRKAVDPPEDLDFIDLEELLKAEDELTGSKGP